MDAQSGSTFCVSLLRPRPALLLPEGRAVAGLAARRMDPPSCCRSGSHCESLRSSSGWDTQKSRLKNICLGLPLFFSVGVLTAATWRGWAGVRPPALQAGKLRPRNWLGTHPVPRGSEALVPQREMRSPTPAPSYCQSPLHLQTPSVLRFLFIV